MTQLHEITAKIRSKNAGPFWITVDVFCGEVAVFDRVAAWLTTARAAQVFGQPVAAIKRFEIKDLNAIKISVPRLNIQGSRQDSDMHGAQLAHLLAEQEIES